MGSNDTFTAEVPTEIEEHTDYKEWVDKAGNQLVRVEAAKSKIENEGLVTSAKDLGDGLYEKKWNNGLRLYFAVIEGKDGKKTLLLLGSGKGTEQDRAIKRAKKNLESYSVVRKSIKKV